MPVMAPQVLLGSGMPSIASLNGERLMSFAVQDEGLKRLLMSWYYAGEYLPVCRNRDLPLTYRSLGYYTGLYEGKQQAELTK